MKKIFLLIFSVVFILFAFLPFFTKSAYACTSGDVQCNVNNVNTTQYCSYDPFSGWHWVDGATCGSNQYCNYGYCYNMVCSPSNWTCTSNTAHKQCYPNGRGWYSAVPCSNGQLCISGTGLCYTSCSGRADFCQTQINNCNASNGGGYNNDSTRDAYCTASNNNTAAYCCSCHLFFCDASCNEWYPYHEAFMVCGQSNVLYDANTANCNGTIYNGPPWNGRPMVCPSVAPVDGVCAATHYTCTAGTPSKAPGDITGDTATQYNWNCNGIGSGSTATCSEIKSIAPIGNHDGSACSVINGWTCDPDKFDQSLNVQIYNGNRDSGGTLLDTITANASRPDVAGSCNGNANVGFNYSPPVSIQNDGNQHSIYVYPVDIDPSGNPTGTNPLLGGSPKTLGPCNYSISGLVYRDGDKSGSYDTSKGDTVYKDQSLQIKVCQGANCNTYSTSTANGTFTTGAAFLAGTYTVSLAGLPQLNGKTDPSYSYSGNSSFTVTVGNPCTPAAEATSSCDASYNVTGVDFGITNSNVWIQSVGGDIYLAANPFKYSTIPQNACGGGGTDDYLSVTQAPQIASPGIIYSGNNNVSFGGGHASVNNWWVGGIAYPEPIELTPQNKVPTSYDYISALVSKSGETTKNLSDASICPDFSNCNLSNSGSLAKGVYTADIGDNGTLNITGANNAFTNGNYIILVKGGASAKLLISTNIVVPANNTLLISSQADIHVSGSVGVTSATDNTTDANANLEGFYSTDRNFYVDGTNNCATGPDKRLNVQGAIVTNAALNGGSLQINRDMCVNDTCPTLSVKIRPDFILSAPLLYQPLTRILREVAP